MLLARRVNHSVEARIVMAKTDWKAPFLNLREQVRPLFDSDTRLYHGILMAPFHKQKALKEVVKNLPAAGMAKECVATIETPTDGCDFHAHFFFGDSGGCKILGQALDGIEDWMRAVPKELLPRFDVPSNTLVSAYQNLVTWTSLVYYLAWELDAPYLQATVEYQPRLEEVSSAPWSNWPQPKGCDPKPVLLHQETSSGDFYKFLERFGEPNEDYWCPDIIGAFLTADPMCAEFIKASLAAIDVLVFMLDRVRGPEVVKQKKPLNRKKLRRNDEATREVTYLKIFLREHHDPRQNPATALKPLTVEEIAGHMGWNEPGAQVKASRRMAKIFGPNAMKKYKSIFLEGNVRRGFIKLLGDGSREIEEMPERSDDDDSRKKHHRRTREGE